MRAATRWVIGAMLAAMAVSACGGEDGTADAVAGDSTVAAAQDPDPGTTPDPTETPAPTVELTPTPAATASVADSAQPLSGVLAAEPGPLGWLLPAGRWTTTALAQPVTFTTKVDLTLLSEAQGAIYLADPAQPASRNLLIVGTAAFVNSGGVGSPQLPVPRDPDQITAFLEASPVTDLEDQGVLAGSSGDASWWEVVLRETPGPSSFPCSLGDRCLTFVTTTGGEPLMALVDERLRLFAADLGEFNVGAYVVGEQSGYESLVAVAEDLVSSLDVALAGPEPSQRFLGSLGIREPLIPAGDYRVHLQSSVVDFAIGEDIEALSLQGSGTRTAMFGNTSGLVSLLGVDGYVDPAADQAGFRDGIPASAEDLVASPQTTSEFDTWLRALAAVTDTGESEIGGLDAPWWDITLDRDAVSQPCGFGPAIGARCITIMASEPFVWFVADNFDSRLYFFEDIATVLYIQAFNGSTVEDMLDAAAPLLGGMTFVPVG